MSNNHACRNADEIWTEAHTEDAIRMLLDGMDTKLVVKYTNLPLEDVQNLAEKINTAS